MTDTLPIHTRTPSPQPERDVADATLIRPLHICYGDRGWLVGWTQIGQYCGFGISKETGEVNPQSAYRTGRRWEVQYRLPIHRLPDGKPRAIPFELDQWLIAYTEVFNSVRRKDIPKPTSNDWRNGGKERERTPVSGVRVPRD